MNHGGPHRIMSHHENDHQHQPDHERSDIHRDDLDVLRERALTLSVIAQIIVAKGIALRDLETIHGEHTVLNDVSANHKHHQ